MKDRHYNQVESPQDEDGEIYKVELFPLNPLYQAKDSEAKYKTQRNQSKPVCDHIKAHMNTSQAVNPAVEYSESNGGFLGADWLYIDKADCQSPQCECCKERDCDGEIFLSFFFHLY